MHADDLIEHVRRAATGDADAFSRIVELLQDMAYACAAAYLGDSHLAQDAAQEAFVAAYLDLQAGKLREPAAFTGWLRTIVRRQCARVKRRLEEAEPLEAARHKTMPAADLEARAEELARQRSAMAALRALPETYRLPTVLYYFSGYKMEEIAEFLDVPVTTVKKRLHDARRKLQEWMVNAMSDDLRKNSPSRDPKFAEKLKRMLQPADLKKAEPLPWSGGVGTEIWEMFCAALTGDLETLKRLLAGNPELARCQYTYRTPLYFAVRENQLEAVALLFKRGADPLSLAINGELLEIARDRGYTEMQKLLEASLATGPGASSKGAEITAAIKARDLNKVRALLDAEPALLHAGDERSNQPLHWAVMTRNLELIDELLRRGANLEARRANGARPLQLTNGDYYFRSGRDVPKDHPTTPQDVLKQLLAKGAYYDICTACHLGDLARVKELLAQDRTLANRLDPYVTYYPCSGSPLRNAANAGHLEIVKLLLEHGADPNLPEPGMAPRGSALYVAAAAGHHEIARLLLERGADPNAMLESSGDGLSRATMNKDEKMIELLASYGAAQPVEILAYYGDVRTAAAVFALDPTKADDPLALAYAAREGQESFMRLMLKYQPDLPKRMLIDQSWAIGAKTRELNEILFKHGMNPSQRDWLGITPLHLFAKGGSVELAEDFINHGADLHARDEDLCSTPLGWAAKFGKLPMVQLLLDRGAKPNLPDDPPWSTPLAWATRRGHTAVVDLLKKHGAQ